MHTYRNQFPADFNAGEYIAELTHHGFTDDSWGNDACPSVVCGNVKVWIDHPEPKQREAGGARFVVCPADHSEAFSAFATDDWDALRAYVGALDSRHFNA